MKFIQLFSSPGTDSQLVWTTETTLQETYNVERETVK